MAKRLTTGGFEKRLLVFFLLLSVTPTLLIAVLGGRYFLESFERVGSPALRESARNSMEIAQKLQARLDKDAHATSQCLADEYRNLPAGRGPARLARLLKTVSDKHQVDFVGLYTLEGSSWNLALSHPDTVARIDSVIALELVSPRDEPQKVIFEDQDAIISGTTCGRDSVFVAGFILDAGTMEMMRNTGDDLSRYSAMPLYARSQGIFLIFVITATVVIMVIASLIVSRLVAGRISHPIKELAAATERVARGDLDHRVTVTAKDEIQSLITAFNRMTEDLQEYKRDLVRAERIAAWRDVARRIAHEIKNPLQPIMNAIYKIRKRLSPDQAERETIEESLDAILKQVTALKTMADEFSSFAKLPEPELKRLDANETMQTVLQVYASSLSKLHVETEFGSDLPDVMADEDQITGLLGNLVKNAIEAMAHGGRLEVRTSLAKPDATGDDMYIRIAITDTGKGIPDDIRDKIFDPYFTTKAKGTGLGLAIVHRIVADHGGRIAFETGPEGTTFAVELKAAGEDAEPPDEEETS
jgi:nitrogen fixation/metabolism regulation signal transduction histidine kinase